MNLFRGFADTARMTEAARHESVRRPSVNVWCDHRGEGQSALAQLAAARAREGAGRAALTQARESQRIIRDRYEAAWRP